MVLIAVTVVQLGVLWESHPHSLAWTNPVFGPSWRNVVDANVDWGQDFYRLREWAEGQSDVSVADFGFGPPWALEEMGTARSARVGPRWNGPIDRASGETVIVVSATELNAYERDEFGLLRSQCLAEVIGETILVYRFDEPPPSLRAPHIGRPTGSCRAEATSLSTR